MVFRILQFGTMDVFLGLWCLIIAYQGNSIMCVGASTVQSDSVYGPKSISLSLSNDTKIPYDLCIGKTDNITVICEVPVADVSPEPRFTFFLNGTAQQSKNVGEKVEEVYRYSLTFKPDVGGLLKVKCLIENSQTRNLFKETEFEMVVREGPQSHIVINVTKNNSTYFQEGDTVNVTCEVSGGYPQVSNVTLSCYSHGTVTHNGNLATLEIVNISRDMQFKPCDCTAKHITGCFPFSSTSTLYVQYPPRITSFTANSDTESTIVDPGSDVILECEADANSKPEIYFQRHHSDKNDFLYKQNFQLQANFTLKDVNCNDSDAYTCGAKNVIWTPTAIHPTTQKSINIMVKCPQQLQTQQDEIQQFSAKVDHNIDIKVATYGYPQPTKYFLQRENDSVITLKSDQTEKQLKYAVKYIPAVASYGDVVLTINNVKQEDFKNYTLTISNGMGTPMNYLFAISEDTSNKAMGMKIEAVLTLLAVLLAAIFNVE